MLSYYLHGQASGDEALAALASQEDEAFGITTTSTISASSSTAAAAHGRRPSCTPPLPPSSSSASSALTQAMIDEIGSKVVALLKRLVMEERDLKPWISALDPLPKLGPGLLAMAEVDEEGLHEVSP